MASKENIYPIDIVGARIKVLLLYVSPMSLRIVAFQTHTSEQSNARIQPTI